MKSRPRRSLLLALERGWREKTTAAGRVLAVAIVVVCAAAMVSLENPIYQLLIALCLLALLDFVVAWLARPRIALHWRTPENAVAGQAIELSCTLANHSRFWAREIGVAAAMLSPRLKPVGGPASLVALGPGDSARVSVALLPLRRGVYPLPSLPVFTLFPFGLFRTRVRTVRHGARPESTRLLVYPRFRPLRAIAVPVNARYQPGGIALSSSVGESPEYIGNREYRPGDPLRHLDHRAWARLATPVVREYQEEYYCRVALVLDTFVPGRRAPGPEGFPELEAAVSLAASVADVLSRGEYIVDIFAAGPELYVFRAGRHTAHFENILEILACVDACRTNPFAKVTPALADELANISSVICVMLDWDADRVRLVRAAAEAGCSVKVAIVRDAPTTLDVAAADLGDAIAQYSPDSVRRGSIEVL